MADAESFLRAIQAASHEDGPRLVYADWLDERGDPLGEFIRLQCPERALWGEEQQRAQDLIRRHQAEWVGALPRGYKFAEFRRGFPELLLEVINSHHFVDSQAERLSRLPATHFIQARFTDRSLDLPEILATSLMRLVVTLEFPGSAIGDFGASVLAAAEVLANLRLLNLANQRIHAGGMRALAESPVFVRLRELDLSGNPLGADGSVAVLTSPQFARLELLDLRSTGVAPDSLRQLMRHAHFEKLHTLLLGSNSFGGRGLTGLLAWDGAARLDTLDLSRCGLVDADIERLGTSPKLASLRRLDLSGNRFWSPGVRALINSPGLRQLDTLVLEGIPLPPGAREALQAHFGDSVAF